MANVGRLDYTIGFKLDKTGLNEVYKSLAQLQTATPNSLLNRNLTSGQQLQQATAQLQAAQQAAAAIGPALQQSFNTRLNVVNVQRFTEEINRTYGSVRNLFTALNQGGYAGQQVAAQLSKTLLTTRTNIQKTQTFLDKMGTTFMNTIKWTLSSSVIKKVTGALSEAVGYVEHLDSSLNDIRIVTKKSADEMDEFAVKANKAAQALGKATTDYTEAALIYYQQGLSDEEVQARAETTLKAANVTGQATATVSEELTAVWNGFKVNAEDTEKYVDKLAAVAAMSASNLQELSVGMSKVASAASNLGIDIDQLTAQISTIISVTRQAPESVGTALKTIYARISDLKLGDSDEDGLKLGDVSGGLEKLGINILDAEGELRDLGIVIEEVAARWDGWTSAQQAAIAQLMAGKRQYNNLVALFSNWDMYEDAINTSKNATGELQKQQDIYMDSTEAHLQQLKTQWEDLYDSILDADAIKTFADIVSGLVSGITKFVDVIGGGSGVFTHFIGLFTTLFSGKIASSINEMIQRFSDNRAIDNLIKARAALAENMYSANGQSTASSEISQAYASWSRYAGVMTNEQREQATYLSENIGKLGEEIDKRREDIRVTQQQIDTEQKRRVEIEAAVDNAQQEFEEQQRIAAEQVKILEANLANNNAPYTKNAKFGRMGADYSAGFSADELNAEWNSTDEAILKIKEDINDVIASTKIADKAVQKFFSQEPSKTQTREDGSQTWAQQDFDKWSSNAVINISAVQEQLKTLHEAGEVSEEDFQRLGQVFDHAFTQGEGGIAQLNQNTLPQTQRALREVGEIAQNVGKKFEGIKATLDSTFDVQAFLKTQPSLDAIDEKIAELNRRREEGEEIEEQTIAALQQQRQILEENNKIYARQSRIQNVTKLIGGITQLGNSLRTVSNVTTSLVSGKGGIGDLFAGITSFAGTSVMAVKNLKDALGSLKNSANATLSQVGQFFSTGAGTGVLAGAMAAYSAISIAISIHQGLLERDAEAAKRVAEQNQELVDKLTEEKDKIDELADSYQELMDAREDGIHFTEEQKNQVNELVKAYGDEHLRVLALTQDYENLGQAIENARADAGQKQEEALKNSEQFYRDSLIADIKANRGITEVDSEGFDFSNAESSGYEDWRNDLAELIGKQGEEAEAFKDYIISSGGHVQWEDLSDILTADTEKIVAFINKYADLDATDQIRELLSENNSTINSLKTTLDETQKVSLELAGFNYVQQNQDNITDAASFDKAVEELAKAKEDLFKDEEDPAAAARIWARDFLGGVTEEFHNYSDASMISSDIISQMNTDLSEAQKDSLANKLGDLTNSEKAYVASMTSLFAHLLDNGKDVDTVFSSIETRLQVLSHEDHVIQIDTILNESSKKKFTEEVEALFSDESFDIGIDAASFLGLAEGLQRALLTTQQLKENLAAQETFSAAEEENAKSLAILENNLNEYENKLREAQEANGEMIAQHEQYMQTLINNIANIDEETKQKFIDDSDAFSNQIESDFEKIIEWCDEAGDNVEKFNEIFQLGTQRDAELSDEFLKFLDLNGGRTAEQIMEMARSYDEHNKKVKKAKQSISELSDQVEQYKTEIGDLQKFSNGEIDWVSSLENTKKAIEELNKVLDELQSSYQSLQDVVEDYNEDGYLTLDNLQKLLEMDSSYVATLEMEDGQLKINDDSYGNLLQSMLDVMEAKATEQYLIELNSIANKENVLTSQALDTANLNNVNTINQVISAAREGTQALYELAAAKAAAEIDLGATQEATKAYENRLKMINNLRSQSTNRALGKASKSSKSGGGSSKKPNTEKELEREEDIYHTINKELEQIESHLTKIQKLQEHRWGVDTKKLLGIENKLLDKQLKKLQEKNKLQVKDLATRRKQLEDIGINFSEDGSAMLNVENYLNGLYADYNKMVEKYNKMSASQQETYKAELETEKNKIEAIEKKIDQYESTYSEFQSTLDELMDVHYEQIENEVKQFNAEVELHLELKEAEKEWNEFWKEVIEDVQDTDFGGQIAASLRQLKTLGGVDGDYADSIIGTNITHLEDIMSEVQKQIDSADRAGEDSLYGDDTKLAHEELTNAAAAVMSNLRDIESEVENIAENYLNILKSAQDIIDKQVEQWESIGKHIEHNIELIQLISGEDAYDALNKQYELQYENNLNLIETQRQSYDFWSAKVDEYRVLAETADKNTKEGRAILDALDEAEKNLIAADEALQTTTINSIKQLKEWRDNVNASIFDTLDKAMSGGMGLDLLEEEWKLIDDYSSKYYDNVERYLNMEEYTNELNEAANAIGLSAENQQKLNAFRDKELKQLKEKEKLTEYDIAESRARLEIMKAQMALEDAQRNKSNMRLRRDSQGNYTYQYTADEGAIEDAERGVLTAKKEWYALVKKQYREATEYAIQCQKDVYEYSKKYQEAIAAGDEVAAAKYLELLERAKEQTEFAFDEAEKNKRDLYSGTAEYFKEVEEANIIPQSKATIRTLVDEWTGSGKESFLGAVKSAINDLDAAQADFEEKTSKVLNTAKTDYENLVNDGMDPALDKIKDLTDSNDDLAKKLEDVNKQLEKAYSDLQKATSEWEKLRAKVAEVIQAYKDLNEAHSKINMSAPSVGDTNPGSADSASGINYTSGSSSPSGSDKGNSPSSTTYPAESPKKTEVDNNTYLHIGGPSSAPGGQHPKYTIIRGDGTIINQGTLNDSVASGWKQGGYRQFANWDKDINKQIGSYKIHKVRGYKYQDTYGSTKYYQFRTGGYTGSWGDDSGRLAVLHQKELVLNQQDTANMLEAIKMLRALPLAALASSIVGSASTNSLLGGIGSSVQALAGSVGSTENISKNMTVNADFSGVRSADAIYQALVELENYGLQNSYSVAPHSNTAY